MRVEEYLALTSKSPNDHPTFADLIGIASEKPPVDEVAEARARKRAALAAQLKAIDSGADLPADDTAPATTTTAAPTTV